MMAQAIAVSCLRPCSSSGFQYKQCSLEYQTSKSLRGLSQEIQVDTLPFPNALTIFEENEYWENFSQHCGNVMKHHPVESDTLSSKIKLLMEGRVLFCSTDR
jgi:hypothetical protein